MITHLAAGTPVSLLSAAREAFRHKYEAALRKASQADEAHYADRKCPRAQRRSEAANRELGRLCERESQIERSIAQTQAVTLSDVAIKLRLAAEAMRGPDGDPPFIDEILVSGALADIERLQLTELPDPLIALCGQARRLHDEMMDAYNRVPADGTQDEHDAAWAAAEKIQARYNAVFEQALATAPASLPGLFVQSALVLNEYRHEYRTEERQAEAHGGDLLRQATLDHLRHIERFSQGTRPPAQQDVPALAAE